MIWMEQSRGRRPEDHLGILRLWKPRPEGKWKGQEGSFMSLRVYSEILKTLVGKSVPPRSSWGIVVRPDACVVNPPKRRMRKVPGCGEVYSFREQLRGNGEQTCQTEDLVYLY